MLFEVVKRILELDTDGTTSRRKKLKVEMSESILLCRRLLMVGSVWGMRPNAMTSVLDLAVAFVNAQLEALGSTPSSGSSMCPPWKVSSVEELVSLLKEYRAQGLVREYSLGSLNYAILESVSISRRKKMLLDVLKQRMGRFHPAIDDKLATWKSNSVQYNDLLRL